MIIELKKSVVSHLVGIKPRTLFLLALALRLSLFLLSHPWEDAWPKRVIGADSFEYAVLGRSLLTRGEFSYTWPNPMPNALRLPAYPLFVGLTSGGGDLSMLWCTATIQVLIDSLFAVFLIRCVRTLFSDALIGQVAGILYAFNPDAILWCTQIMPESLSVWVIGGALYGLAAALNLPEQRIRFAFGVFCASILPLTKPAWQYLWFMLLAVTIIAVFRARQRSARVLILAGLLVMLVPAGVWIGRNFQAWGIPALSVNGPLAQEWAAKAVLEGAGPDKAVPIPEYTREMDLHINFITDYSQADWIRPRFKEIKSWNRDGLAEDIKNEKGLLPKVLRHHFLLYVKSTALATADVLFAPQNKNIKEFLGLPIKTEVKWHTMSGSHLDGGHEIAAFIKARAANPLTLTWSCFALGFLALYYGGAVMGIKPYINNYIWNIWTLYIIGVAGMLLLIGPLGQARYRFVMTQPFLALASIGIANWLRKDRDGPNT